MSDEFYETNEQVRIKTHAFDLAVYAKDPDWPESANGVKPVLSAVQKMLSAASAGRKAEFQLAQAEMENAAALWQGDLFGDSDDH